MSESLARRVLACFLPFAAGYFLSYLFRSVNAVVGPSIADELQLDAAALGALTSAYFAAFVLSQIPLGIVLDRYGPGRVQAILLSSAVLGSIVFATAPGAFQLTVGRALIGLGVSGCLMSAFMANSLFWPRERLAMVNGLLLACGGIGAMVATVPTQWALSIAGWRPLFIGLAIATAAVVAYVWIAVPAATRSPTARTTWREAFVGVATVFRSAAFWRIAPMSLALHAVFLAYQGLWAGPWLRDVAGLPPESVAAILFAVTVAMIVGFASSGALLHLLTRAGLTAETVIAGVSLLFVGLQVPVALGAASWSPWLWPAFGLVGTSVSLAFTWVTQQFPPALSGRVVTSLNLLVFLAAFVVQSGVGVVLTWFTGAPSWIGHGAAVGILIALQLAGWVWFVWPRPQGRVNGNPLLATPPQSADTASH